MNKIQLQEHLKSLGIAFTTRMKIDGLRALVPQDVSSQAQGQAPAQVAAPVVEPAAPPQPDQATVFDLRGNPARTYTKEQHGENFRELAEEFAKKRGWAVR